MTWTEIFLITLAFIFGVVVGYVVRDVYHEESTLEWSEAVSIGVLGVYFLFLYAEFTAVQYSIPYALHIIGALSFGHITGQKINRLVPWKK